MMKLIGNHTSPFVRKIHVILQEKGIPFELLPEHPKAPGSKVSHYNPLNKIPVLIADNGEIIYESTLIAQYLELTHPAPAILPSDPWQSLHVKQVEGLANGVIDAAVLMFYEKMRPEEKQYDEFIEYQRQKVIRGMVALEQYAQQRQWLNGEQMNLADITTACFLGWAQFRGVIEAFHHSHPALGELFDRLHQRESFKDSTPKV